MTEATAGNHRRLAYLASAAMLAAGALLLVCADPSYAGASKVGKNVGTEIKTWATSIILGVAALVGVPVLAKRDLAAGMTLAILVIVIGGFVFAPEAVKDTIGGLWKSTGG